MMTFRETGNLAGKSERQFKRREIEDRTDWLSRTIFALDD